MLHIVVPGEEGMQDQFLNDGQQKMINGEYFTFNNSKLGAINFYSKDGFVECNSPYSISTMNMLTQQTNQYEADSVSRFVINKKTLHTANGLNFVFKGPYI